MIERGRYTSPKMPVENRLCNFCTSEEVEDEFHFVMVCTLYQNLRTALFEQLNDIHNFHDLNDSEKFILIMSANDHETILAVTNYVRSAFDKRSSADCSL